MRCGRYRRIDAPQSLVKSQMQTQKFSLCSLMLLRLLHMYNYPSLCLC